MPAADPNSTSKKRVLLLGATGTIGRATMKELAARGHELVCFIRPQSDPSKAPDFPESVGVRYGDVTGKNALAEQGFQGETFDAVVSCLASRTGVSKDAWALDYQANSDALSLARQAGVTQFVLLSAICVQKPKLAFQKAKLAFERELIESGLDYSIVRPTAFFKSLSGQIERVMSGKSYMMFGNGELTACKPVSDEDLAAYLADCLEQGDLQNRILPIGGPGPAITPKEQGEYLFSLLGESPRLQRAPPGLLKWMGRILGAIATIFPPLAARAEYAKIGHYYATESMLVFDPQTETYRADLTPSTGTRTLFDHYRDLVQPSAKGTSSQV